MKADKYTLWIESYNSRTDNAGYKFDSLTEAVKNAQQTAYRYGIRVPCTIFSESGKRYKFTIVDKDNNVLLNKRQIKKYQLS